MVAQPGGEAVMIRPLDDGDAAVVGARDKYSHEDFERGGCGWSEVSGFAPGRSPRVGGARAMSPTDPEGPYPGAENPLIEGRKFMGRVLAAHGNGHDWSARWLSREDVQAPPGALRARSRPRDGSRPFEGQAGLAVWSPMYDTPT